MNFSGTRAEALRLSEQVDRLNSELENLKELLKKQGECDKVGDEEIAKYGWDKGKFQQVSVRKSFLRWT